MDDFIGPPVFGSINVTPDGIKAIVTLSTGDMRRSLNILQVMMLIKSNRILRLYHDQVG